MTLPLCGGDRHAVCQEAPAPLSRGDARCLAEIAGAVRVDQVEPAARRHVAGRVVSTVAIHPRPAGIADATSPGAAPFGVTGELHGASDYAVTSRWADRLRADGFDALLHAPRFTPGQERALALFGEGGNHPHRPVEATRSLADVLDQLGYRRDRSAVPSRVTVDVDDDAGIEDASAG